MILIFRIFSSIGQINGKVIDKKTKKPIEYVNIWVENENIGTTSGSDGNFSFEKSTLNKILILSAIGYESLSIEFKKNKQQIKLVPKVYGLQEVKVVPKKRKILKISKIKVRKATYGNSTPTPLILTRYLPYNKKYCETPFLKSVKILTKSQTDSAIFKFRIFKPTVNRAPGKDLINQNLIVNVKKGKNYVTINLEKFHLKMPEEGCFIAVEWIILKSNAFLKTGEVNGKKHSVYSYQPKFYMDFKGLKENLWFFLKGKWFNDYYFPIDVNLQLAAEVILTD